MSIEDQANAVKNMLLAEIDKSKTIVFDGLLNNTMLNSIPESLFVNYFLPCFIGEPKSPNWVMEWISIAGTPMAEVGVFQDGTKQLLFTVPSILNTNNLFLHKQGGDLGDIFSRFDQINNNTPSRGLGFLIQALNSKNQELLSKINFNDVNKKWYDILTRYRLVSVDTQTTQTTSNEPGDYFEM